MQNSFNIFKCPNVKQAFGYIRFIDNKKLQEEDKMSIQTKLQDMECDLGMQYDGENI